MNRKYSSFSCTTPQHVLVPTFPAVVCPRHACAILLEKHISEQEYNEQSNNEIVLKHLLSKRGQNHYRDEAPAQEYSLTVFMPHK